ncbi:probable LRR receptor-like serine/threonine-protein kinase At5g45780 [Camellia sinensis]|uniref:probable LRR receptor-like serine/threonine-protein kinase At5g45780 n=1 Tax=Camellia sinensis TaxID=4442 RepID=UPI0010369C42|nr:probable LRR receptor-like serine/threonine-protein kinase At5g45780 [Camellia sinensis]XP_028053997.1 probable LRR receptor-like serine/threonine-protein kinase At5g45780 [Camellia sinensis]
MQHSAALFFFLGGLVVLLILLILVFIFWKIIKPEKLKKSVGCTKGQQGSTDFFSGNLRTISYFAFHKLKKATKNFHHCNLLGRGGFGPVYRGKLEDGWKVGRCEKTIP